MWEGQGQPHFPECSLCAWHYVSRALVHSNLTAAPWVATIICTLLEEKEGLRLSEDYRRIKDRVTFDFWESGNATSTCSFHAGKDLGPQTLRRYCWGTWKAHSLREAGRILYYYRYMHIFLRRGTTVCDRFPSVMLHTSTTQWHA